jgi:hypothetical protein
MAIAARHRQVAPAALRRRLGSYPDGTVHRLVEDRLRGYAERLRDFAAPHGLLGVERSKEVLRK